MISLAVVLALALILPGLGWPLVARLDRAGRLDGLERVAIALLVGAWLLYLAVFAVGLARLDRLSMGALLLAAMAAAVPGWRAMPWRRWAAGVGADWAAAPWGTRGLIAVTAAVALSSFLQGLAPPNDYDGLMYHLTMPKFDIETGRIGLHWGITGYVVFPQLLGHLYRLVMAVGGDAAVQCVHGLTGLAAAALAAAIARRLGAGMTGAWTAALLFLALRVVVWEMGTAEVDLLTAAIGAAVVVVALAWRERAETGLALLLGLTLGVGLCGKYNVFAIGIALALPLLATAWPDWRRVGQLLLAASVSFAVFAPHAGWAWLHTGNPIFPLFNTLFNPGQPQPFAGSESIYGDQRTVLNLLTAPWDIFIRPTAKFDGMIIGAPLLLMLMPAALLRPSRPLAWIAGFCGVFFVLWFFVLSQQVRFLLPIMPHMAALAAIGAGNVFSLAAGNRLLVAALGGAMVIAALNQSLFVGIYAALRLPPALGLVSAERYHADTPTLQGGFYQSCRYVSDNLRPGERYLGLIWPHSFYCPQAAADVNGLLQDELQSWRFGTPLAAMTPAQVIETFERENIRFVILMHGWEKRVNDSSRPEVITLTYDEHRLARHFIPALETLSPLAQDRFSAVYDAKIMIEIMKKRIADAETRP